MITFFKRVTTSAVLIGLSLFLLFQKEAFWFSLQVLIFAAIAMYELFTLLKKANVPVYRFFGVFMGIVIPALAYMELGRTQSGEVLFLVLGCLFLFVIQFFRKENPNALVGISLTLFGILYVSWFLSFLIKLRFVPSGEVWVAYLIAVTKSSDIGAYCVGSLFGRHSLIPYVSPKKTVEGAVGGLLFSAFVSWAFKSILPLDFTVFHLIFMGCLIGVVAQIGDLSESLMKRFCSAKDSGSLFPGMGGVLDAVDSILFTAPLFYFHLMTYPGASLQ